MELQELIELNKSIRNRCQAMVLLYEFAPKDIVIDPIIHTLTEDNFEDIQAATDGFCVVESEQLIS